MKKLVPERNFLKENRKLDKLNDSLFLQNCELKRKENKDKKYIELLQNKNIDAVIEKDRIKKENYTLKEVIEDYEKLLEEDKNNLFKIVEIFTKEKTNLEKNIEEYQELIELYQKERKSSKQYIEELEKRYVKNTSFIFILSAALLISAIISIVIGVLK